jgi:hypothetical protein
VCEGSWGMPDAKVACRQLGFTKTVGYSHYGRGTGKLNQNVQNIKVKTIFFCFI